MKTIFTALIFISSPLFAQVLQPKALVYGGSGACEEDCVAGAVAAAEAAGFSTEIVLPQTYNKEMLKDAAVWVQPGGYAKSQSKSMGKTMMNDVRAFVKNGGGYVGYCAGAFLATNYIGTSWTKGYGFIPGTSKVYKALGYPTIEKTSFSGEKKDIYWEGGPYFKLSSSDLKKSEARGNYLRTNQVAFVRAPYGKGRAYVTGLHPESPQWWKDVANLEDTDGLDISVTTAMMKWAAGLE